MTEFTPKTSVLSWRNWLLEAVFPPRCAAAQNDQTQSDQTQNACAVWSRELFCDHCRQTLQPITAPLCALCGAPFDRLAHAELCAECRANRYHQSPPFDAARSLYAFEGAMRRAIHRLKYEGKTSLAPPLSALMSEHLRTSSSTRCVEINDLTQIVAVPLHTQRERRRGFNQSELLARELAKQIGVSCTRPLRRTRATTPQVELPLRERATNVQDAFVMNENAEVKGARILLIDDVYTTGATLKECAQVLKNGGAEKVYALTLARAL